MTKRLLGWQREQRRQDIINVLDMEGITGLTFTFDLWNGIWPDKRTCRKWLMEHGLVVWTNDELRLRRIERSNRSGINGAKARRFTELRKQKDKKLWTKKQPN